MNSTDALNAGAGDLASALVADGFSFVLTGMGRSSGGDFASGEFRRDDRRLELHFRHELGLVTYHAGEITFGHQDYVRAVRALDGIDTASAYPGFHPDAASQFRALREDLRIFGARFLRGAVEQLREVRTWVDQHPKPTGFAGLP